MKKFTSNIITSKSLFSFPILDDVFIETETNENSFNPTQNRKGRTKNDTNDQIKNDRRRSHESGTRRIL
jgi:hypothetical protein